MQPQGQARQPRRRQRSNGDGSLYRRRDGLWEATAVGYEDASACRLGLN